MSPSTQLRRNMANRQIAGVAAGLSDFFGIDATLVRVLFVLSLFFTGGAGPLIYLLCWMVVPKAPTPYTQAPRRKHGLAWVIAVVALIIGFVITVNDHRTIVIAAIVLVGAAVVWRKVRGRESWKTRKEFEKARLAWQRRLDEQSRQAAGPTPLGGNPFQIGSFYSPPPGPGSPLDLDGPGDPYDPNNPFRNT